MAGRRKGARFAQTPRLIRASLSRVSKSNKPNYNEDVVYEEDEPVVMTRISVSSKARQRQRHHHDRSTRVKTQKCRSREMEIAGIVSQNICKPEVRNVFALLIDMGLVPEFLKTHYMDLVCKRVIGTCLIIREGILCYTCKTFFASFSEFGSHRGDDRVTPERMLVPSTNMSLFDYQQEAWDMMKTKPGYDEDNNIKNKQDLSDSSDDSCIICGDGGNLICCPTCPSTYHQSCLKLQGTPPDDWKCVYCRCKYCGDTADKERMLLPCALCLKKYHKICFEGDDSIPISLNAYCSEYCSDYCGKIDNKLKEMLGVKTQIGKNLSWSFIKRDNKNSPNIILSNLKIVIASKIMEESFEPIIDRFTKINMVRSVVLNSKSNFPRIDFSGFFTAILESSDDIISAASIRVHGPKLAEIPFIATSKSWRNKGMGKALLRSIETALSDIGVEHIYVPSTLPMVRKWITSYGFKILSNDVRKEIINTNCLMFLSTTRLEKNIKKRDSPKLLPDLNQDPPQE